MNQDLKYIKKQYGEKMMHLCREIFSTILDTSPGLLPKILIETFYPTHYLYDDLVTNNAIQRFKNYIYTFYDKFIYEQKESSSEIKCHVDDPETLMRQAGYTLYECKTEEDIQSFRKYYTFDEALCTFRGDRLKTCFVYFAVKDNADKLERSSFTNPNRQDEYGTSVISIQFTRDYGHTLSIKNRYNHTVANPDATFSNDLDNIIPGLTQSFADYYGMKQEWKFLKSFELLGYVRANNGKIYKYNYEINNVYYCPGNVIINQFHATELPKEKYLIMDYFILDLVNKKIINYSFNESFPETIGKIKNISIKNTDNKKIVTITPEIGEDVIVELDQYNRIIGYINNNVKKISSNFLSRNKIIEKIELNNVVEIGDDFLYHNCALKEIHLPKVEIIGNYFLSLNNLITYINFPNVTEIGNEFMTDSIVTEISMPKLLKIGNKFMRFNMALQKIDLPSVISINAWFLDGNMIINDVSLPNARSIGPYFLSYNSELTSLSLPNAQDIKNGVLSANQCLKELHLPKVRCIGNCFMTSNRSLKVLELPSVISIGVQFLYFNNVLQKAIMPNLRSLGDGALTYNSSIQEFYVPLLSSKLENRKLKKLARKSKPKLYQRILNINKRK